MRARHRLSKMLLRRGLVYREGNNWTHKHRRWLRALPWPHHAEHVVFGDYLHAVEQLEERLRGLDAALQEQSELDPYREPVGWLRCLRGFDTVNAMTLVAELFEVARFSTPRQLMSYLGLVPSEHSSGTSRRQGSITKSGNRHVRRALVNAARHYTRRPNVGLRAPRRHRGDGQTGNPPRRAGTAAAARHRAPPAAPLTPGVAARQLGGPVSGGTRLNPSAVCP
jgi:transposase